MRHKRLAAASSYDAGDDFASRFLWNCTFDGEVTSITCLAYCFNTSLTFQVEGLCNTVSFVKTALALVGLR